MPKIKNFKGFVSLDLNKKELLLKALGYYVEKGFVFDENTHKKVICKYTKQPVWFKSASILPGSTIIINTTPLTISKYIEEYLEE